MRTLTLAAVAALPPGFRMLCVVGTSRVTTADRAVMVATILRGGIVRFAVS